MKALLLISLICISLCAAAQVPADVIAHYPMNGDAADAGKNGNDGTIIGGVTKATDRFGNPCGALKFDGSSGYLTVSSSPSLKRPQNAFTVTVWAKMEVNPASPTRKWLTVCCKSNVAAETFDSPQFRVQSMQDDARGYNTVSINTDFTEPANENLILGQWFFYVLRYDGQSVSAYIDGKIAFTFAYSKAITPNDMPLEIGRDTPGGMEFFCGTMDELRIYERALTVAEINSLYRDQSGKVSAPAVTITCPDDITNTAQPGQCDFPVNYPEPTASVDCGSANIQLVSGLAREAAFPVGQTTVTYMATSTAGNTATCSFVVTVEDNNLPAIQCPKSKTVPCDPGDCAAIVQYIEPDGNSPCATPDIERIKGGASGTAFAKGENTITYRATDASGKTATCSFKIIVKDQEKPEITCPKDREVQADAGKNGAKVTYNEPEFADNCPNPVLSQTDGLASGAIFPSGTNTISYQVKDAAGNTVSCTFEITVDSPADLGIKCPKDIVVAADDGDCAAIVSFKAATLTGNMPDATVTQMGGGKSGSSFAVGSETIEYTATHDSGAEANCNFKVTVKDMEDPTITCPKDKHLQATAEGKGAKATFEQPKYADNCPGAALSRTDGLASGAIFPIGSTTVTFQVKDAAGNKATCSFEVVVDQPADLGIKCPQDIVVPADPTECAAIVAFKSATLTGNLPDATIKQTGGLKTGSNFPVGSQPILFTATHPSGATANCSFNVTVKDMEKPFVECPNDVHLQAKIGTKGAKFSFEEPNYGDNCPGSVLQTIGEHKSGSVFPIGASSITYQVKDVAGNTSTCAFTVTVTQEAEQIPNKIDEDTVIFQKDILTVNSDSIRVYYYDNQDQDGDTISINFDGKWIVDHEKILGKKKVLENNHYIDLVITPGQVHYLVSKAWNEGKKPTNTLTIEIHDGVSVPRIINLTSLIGKSSAIKIVSKH